MLYLSKPHILFLSILLLPPFFIYAQEPKSSAQPSPVNNTPTFNNKANPKYNVNMNPIVHVHTNTTSIINAVGIKTTEIFLLMKEFVQDKVTKKNYELLKDLIKEWLWESRYKIVGGTIVGSYSATSLLLIADYNRAKDMYWVHWKKHATFEDLCAIPQKELARELMLAVGQHNVNSNNPTDLAHPLINFIKEIDYEINTFKRYIKTVQTIQYLHLIPIFPTNEKKLNRATRMLERVLFIKHIFLSWLADYNLTSAEKMNHENIKRIPKIFCIMGPHCKKKMTQAITNFQQQKSSIMQKLSAFPRFFA